MFKIIKTLFLHIVPLLQINSV